MSYGKFRDFLILLPQAKLVDQDPNIAWFEAATLVPFGAAGAALRPLLPQLAASKKLPSSQGPHDAQDESEPAVQQGLAHCRAFITAIGMAWEIVCTAFVLASPQVHVPPWQGRRAPRSAGAQGGC